MASVSKDGRDGRWLARWRDPGGRQRKKSFARRADAQRWLDQVQAELHRGQYIAPHAARTRFGDVAGPWSAGLAHLKESTATRYRSIVRTHILPQFGDWEIGALRHSDIRDWLAGLHAGGLAPGSVRQTHRVLSLILDDAVRDSRIARNPASGVRLPRPTRAEPRFLTAGEVKALVEAAEPEGLSVAVLAFTGLRFGELAGLRAKRIDLRRRRLTVAESVTEVAGRLVWSTPKTHQTRSVPLPRGVASALEEHCVDKKPDDLVFTAPRGGVLRLNNWRRRVFNPASAALARTDISPHVLRHTAASLAIAAGANVKAVQRMLGHASAAMTLDVYAGLFADDLDAVAVALDAVVPHLRHASAPPGSTDRRADYAEGV